MPKRRQSTLEASLKKLSEISLNPLDLLSEGDLPEKLINLVLLGPPAGSPIVKAIHQELANLLTKVDVSEVKVVVFGGGTGLSNVIGGDSRTLGWPRAPFWGLKTLFPKTRSIVCVTDDGGSTGEMLKDFPLIALGDIRHVLLSCVQQSNLEKKYGLSEEGALAAVAELHQLFNFRFTKKPVSPDWIIRKCGIETSSLPTAMWTSLAELLSLLFTDVSLRSQLNRPHCLGNLLLAAAISRQLSPGKTLKERVASSKLIKGVQDLAEIIGADRDSVMPCTTTPASLKICYANGVIVTGENKSGNARRGYPVDRVYVEFAYDPQVPKQLLQTVAGADIIIFAPGSLFTSIIPILQVPGIAEAVRENRQALKILVANLWIQRGETDLVGDDPARRYYVSDLIMSYNRNIPGGVEGLFHQILGLRLQDIPGSVLQNYAVEGKLPIYLDRSKVRDLGFMPVESRIFSQKALDERKVIQHDPDALARAVRTLWAIRGVLPDKPGNNMPAGPAAWPPFINRHVETPALRFNEINKRLHELDLPENVRGTIADILWRHQDIPLAHLDYISGLNLISPDDWRRNQIWDKVFSFYDPVERRLNVRSDIADKPHRFEVAFLVALGQSLLGNYVSEKQMESVFDRGRLLGKVYLLRLRAPENRTCFLDSIELSYYLTLVRMQAAQDDQLLYTRLINGNEGFTPPGLLFGLVYAWYLDNRFTAHVEYKMSIIRTEISDLIPEQVKVFDRRRELIDFFRRVVFKNDFLLYDLNRSHARIIENR